MPCRLPVAIAIALVVLTGPSVTAPARAGAAAQPAPTGRLPPALAAPSATDVRLAVITRLERDAGAAEGGSRTSGRLAALYEAREFRPLWHSQAMVLALRAAWEDARRDGILARELIADIGEDPFAWPGAVQAATARELRWSDALLTLLDRLANGRADARGLAPVPGVPLAWRDVATTDIAALAALDDPAGVHALIERARPRTDLYRRLHAAMSDELERREPPPIGPGPTLEAGSAGARVLRLRARLLPEGDLAPRPRDLAARWDAGLQAAVRAFQARNGLAPDGQVGPRTLTRLDLSRRARIDALRVNLERARWYARVLGEGDRVVVNIPDYRLSVHLDGEIAWQTPVVVGSREHRTPVFTSHLDRVVLDPTWTVPRSIVADSLFAQAKADPAAFAAAGYRLRAPDGTMHRPDAVDWSTMTLDRFDYWVVQSPGPANALGTVKFLFDNPYSVYLHDTPAQQLFARHERAFSRGCVRVQDPQRLEALLLGARAAIDGPAIDAWRHRRDNVLLTLDEPIAVGLLYWTADVDARGRLRLLPDVYGRDRAVLAGLEPPLPG